MLRKIFLLLCMATGLLHHPGFSQSSAPRIGCKDADMLMQATENKTALLQQGFEVLNDAMLEMESRSDFPIIVRLQEGVFYQIVFIGNTRAKKMNLDLYYGQDKALIKKETQPYSHSQNRISFSFTPEKSGDYTLLLSQTLKQQPWEAKGKTCGSLTIYRLKKTEN